MYSIKLVHSQGLTLDRTVEIVQTVYAELRWENDDGTTTLAATAQSCIWTPKTAKRADAWARARGLDLKADYGAYLRKHGERKEVVLKREADEENAARQRRRAINGRLMEKRDQVLAAVKAADPALGSYLETGVVA